MAITRNSGVITITGSETLASLAAASGVAKSENHYLIADDLLINGSIDTSGATLGFAQGRYPAVGALGRWTAGSEVRGFHVNATVIYVTSTGTKFKLIKAQGGQLDWHGVRVVPLGKGRSDFVIEGDRSTAVSIHGLIFQGMNTNTHNVRLSIESGEITEVDVIRANLSIKGSVSEIRHMGIGEAGVEHKIFPLANSQVIDQYSPALEAGENIGTAFEAGNSDTDIFFKDPGVLAGWDSTRRFQLYGNGRITVQRTISVRLLDGRGAPLSGVKCYFSSGADTTVDRTASNVIEESVTVYIGSRSNAPLDYSAPSVDKDYQIQHAGFIKYDRQIAEIDSIDLSVSGLDTSVFLAPDNNITESNTNTVAGYTKLDTRQKIYDFAKLFLVNNYAGESINLVYLTSGGLKSSGFNITLDKTAPEVFRLSGDTIIIRADSLTSSIELDNDREFITRNDAIHTGSVIDRHGDSYIDIEGVAYEEVRVYSSGASAATGADGGQDYLGATTAGSFRFNYGSFDGQTLVKKVWLRIIKSAVDLDIIIRPFIVKSGANVFSLDTSEVISELSPAIFDIKLQTDKLPVMAGVIDHNAGILASRGRHSVTTQVPFEKDLDLSLPKADAPYSWVVLTGIQGPDPHEIKAIKDKIELKFPIAAGDTVTKIIASIKLWGVDNADGKGDEGIRFNDGASVKLYAVTGSTEHLIHSLSADSTDQGDAFNLSGSVELKLIQAGSAGQINYFLIRIITTGTYAGNTTMAGVQKMHYWEERPHVHKVGSEYERVNVVEVEGKDASDQLGGGLTADDRAKLDAIKGQADKLEFTGGDVRATLGGEAVETNPDSRQASRNTAKELEAAVTRALSSLPESDKAKYRASDFDALAARIINSMRQM